MAEIRWQVWGTPANFNGFRVLALLLHRRRSINGGQPNFARLAASWAGTLYTLGGSCPLTEFCQVQKNCVQVLRSAILAALLHGTLVVRVSQSLRRGTRNGITELSQRALPILGRAAITLGIGPQLLFTSRPRPNPSFCVVGLLCEV